MPQTASRPFTVLVVDDEPDVRDLLVEYFRDRGHTVTSVADGRAAVQEIEQNASRYTLIVSDLQLPGVDGLGVLKAARAANPSVVVIIVTGLHDDNQAQEIGQHLLKVFDAPFQLTHGRRCSVGLTVGYALVPVDGTDPVTLLQRADAAMYAGKQGGKRCVRRARLQVA